jgi:hypothetical protein
VDAVEWTGAERCCGVFDLEELGREAGDERDDDVREDGYEVCEDDREERVRDAEAKEPWRESLADGEPQATRARAR